MENHTHISFWMAKWLRLNTIKWWGWGATAKLRFQMPRSMIDKYRHYVQANSSSLLADVAANSIKAAPILQLRATIIQLVILLCVEAPLSPSAPRES